ncbi:MAG: ABC transporter permease subunit [Gemmatimonadetes bacterium]|jgi:ABC-type transport system involved in multi-copper enzyme maturation permease subunit|nr:ABC transporter permease subunit [Gemmatimonadota bacterium]MBT5059652.1 ABC transporter permease subunit [Gemmatimonadota bacterium]MBT5587566.1 ABC transporter permease subunit [Gemmatimonadota bacterium]MBT5965233.1 ABC transporter permease subunit [Gemmatimonadota bacterium]MBT7456426.1 ABC transporter permease subunit [Gemmatimonadota bacterium]
MLTVFIHQLHDNLRSQRFQVSLGILLLFFVANGVIYSMKMQRMTTQFARSATFDEDRYDRAETLSDAVDNELIIRTGDVGVEYIAEAGSFWFEYGRYVNAASGTTLWPRSSRTTNAWMRHFEVLDWCVIARYVLSFLCIVLSYNAISGELESGSLRLALSGPLSRTRYLLGKYLGHLVTLAVAAAIGTLLSLTVMVVHGVLEMNAAVAANVLLFFIAMLLYVSVFLLLGLGVSAWSRNSATSLVLLLTTWTCLIVVVPQSSYLIAMMTTDPVGPYQDRVNDVMDEVRAGLRQQGLEPRPIELARVDDYAIERRYAARLRELGTEVDRLQRNVQSRRIEQYETARRVNLLSPGFAFQYSVETLLGTGIDRYRSFDTQAWRYRDDLREFLRARDAADPDSPHILFLEGFMSQRPLDSDDVPRFKERPLSFAAALTAGVVPITILLLETVLALLFALRMFNRAELTGQTA